MKRENVRGTPTLEDRARFYSEAFPAWPPLQVDGRWLSGVWLLGNDYRGSGYYGSYPPGYLRRSVAIFPDAERVLHLLSGSLPESADYVRFDIRPEMKPDVVGDAHRLSEHFESESFDLILADPPYSSEDADHYGHAHGEQERRGQGGHEGPQARWQPRVAGSGLAHVPEVRAADVGAGRDRPVDESPGEGGGRPARRSAVVPQGRAARRTSRGHAGTDRHR